MGTQQKILDQTFTLVMKYGIKSVSMDDISSGIGISKKTIYQYFENKKSLLASVVENHISKDEREMTALKEASSNAIEEMVLIAKHVLTFLRGMSPSMMFDTKKYYPEIWHRIEEEHFTFIRNTVKANVVRGQREGLYLEDANAEIISLLYVRQTLALADEEIFPLSKFDRMELFKTMVTYHVRGLMSTDGRLVAKNYEIV